MPRQDYDYSTGQSVTDEHLRLCGDDSDTSIEAEGETSLIFALNLLKRQVINMPFGGLYVGSNYVAPIRKPWDFLEEQENFTAIAKTSLSAALAEDATTASITDASSWDSSNGAFITFDSRGTWDYVAFTTRSSNSLTGVTDVDLGNASGDDCEKLYPLPTNLGRIIGVWVSGEEYHEVPENPQLAQFSIISDPTGTKSFLWLPRNTGTKTVVYKYQLQTTDLAVITGTMDTPTELDLYFIEMLNARYYRLNGNPQADIDRAHTAAFACLHSFIQYVTFQSNRMVKLTRGPIRSPVSSYLWPPVRSPND